MEFVRRVNRNEQKIKIMNELKEKICEILFKRSEYTKISEFNGLHQLHEREFDNVSEDVLALIEQSQKTRPHETIVIDPKWETPDEFGLYEIFDDGSFQFLHDILFWAFIPTNTKNEIHLCGVDESGLYGYSPELEDRYDTGWSLDDVQYCMRYEQKGQ